ncbi:MAG: hypothetical protein IJ890_05440 [Clostridia bacterium]|nr:hypothetical protein [Clostridia bacterium]
MNGVEKYKDIINLPHHVSKKHPQMSLEARAAQFAPFAALTGYGDAVKETARLTSDRKEINEEEKESLDIKLQIIQELISTKPQISITYFVPDNRKKGGEYVTVSDKVRKIDRYNQVIILENMKEIPILEIIEMSGEIFQNYNEI